MSDKLTTGITRRDLMKATGTVAAASALSGVVLPQVHAGESDAIKVAVIGCGGRGTDAIAQALSVRSGQTRLVAMADVFQNRLDSSYRIISRDFPKLVDVPRERRFVGFDAYRHAMDSLRAGDIAILATPPAFRWVQFTYAIERRLNVFMEKPVSVDGPSSRRMFRLAEMSEKQGLKVGVGLMCRHCDVRKELFDRIRNEKTGLGTLSMLRAYRMAGPTATAFSPPRPANIPELHYQIQRFHSFLWASGGAYSDFLIHNIDECSWMKDAWPVRAQSNGGRHYRGNNIDQNFDSYSTEFTYADGTKFYLEGRTMPGCHNQFASYAHGARGSCIISANGHTPCRSRIYRGHDFTNNADIVWRAPAQEANPYQLEWDHLVDAIRNNRPYNEARRGTEASLVTAMGRMSAHTGQTITRDQMLACEHEFAPGVDKLTLESPAPLLANKEGRYAVPQPGVETRREY